jgi:pimeloyl-ACP methyl ester carboxylesterase
MVGFISLLLDLPGFAKSPYILSTYKFLPMSSAQQKLIQQTIEVNGTTLYYEKSGKGRPLLLLHGWTQTSAFWKPYVADFESEYEVYSVDLRGHGKSSPLTDDFSIEQASRDIAELIDKLELKLVKAVGLSYGGLVLLELSKLNKDLIHSMVIIGTSYQYNGRDAQKDKSVFSYDNMDIFFKTYLKQQHIHGEAQIRALFNSELNYSISLSSEDLKKIQSHVLIINGDSDEIADIRQAVEMRKLIPNSALWIIPRTGHLALTEDNRPDFISLAKSFFAQTDMY